jgi:hypothetical protein
MNQQHNSPIARNADGQPAADPSATPGKSRKFLTPQVKLQILHLVSLGLSLVDIAPLVGFSARGIRKAADLDPDFKLRLKRNRIDTLVLCMQTLKEAAGDKKHWRCIPLLRELAYPKPQERSEEELLDEFRAVLSQILWAIGSILTGPEQRAQLDRELAKINFTFLRTLKQSHTPPPPLRSNNQLSQRRGR